MIKYKLQQWFTLNHADKYMILSEWQECVVYLIRLLNISYFLSSRRIYSLKGLSADTIDPFIVDKQLERLINKWKYVAWRIASTHLNVWDKDN